MTVSDQSIYRSIFGQNVAKFSSAPLIVSSQMDFSRTLQLGSTEPIQLDTMGESRAKIIVLPVVVVVVVVAKVWPAFVSH